MKLYCVKILTNDIIADVQHIFANDNKEVHKRMDEFINECTEYKLEYNGYRFHEVDSVDGFTMGWVFDKYKIANNKIIFND